MAKKGDMGKSNMCNDCGVCSVCKWLLPLIIIVLAAVPKWYGTPWVKWVIIIAALLLILKKWCPCQNK